MNSRPVRATALLFATFTAIALLRRADADPAGEMKRLATLMDWKQGTIVADIGAGDGRFAFAAAQIVGPSGKVFATEIDQEKLTQLRAEIAKRRLNNVVVVESKEADTNLPAECCDSILLRRVYHHLTKPTDFDASLVRSLKPAGRLAIIEFPPRAGLEPVEGVPANRGGHGIPQKIAIQELTSAGFTVARTVDDWPDGDYLILLKRE